ncbi:glycoside hydrolase family 43 protein [Aeoliella mucimassa]|uniref:Glycosyl hydrolases family 43 n=1 Tax=Aeoliella mucimassa TaxID=2527972 RepID=A0A518AK66_9BACT|nr:glycoside hydrolase family 43 protein [Aeoliella mucimassa]QDU55113.1 Glycosyl hydrolases family 43 [Aeoliella mucimassa]
MTCSRVWSLFVLSIVLAWANIASAENVLLFPYFDSNGENGVFLAWSSDGRTFHPVNDGRPIFTPPKWSEGQHLTRDPSIVFHDGLFHMVWTSNWDGRWFGYASSPDLKQWSEPVKIQPFADGKEQPNNVWAPELFRDPVAGDFKIVWSSTLPSELNDDDGSADTHGHDHRMYYISTSDFKSFSEPKLLFNDENYSVIDAQVAFDPQDSDDPHEGRWIMALKRETPVQQDGKNIRLAFSPAEISPESFTNATKPIVGASTSIQGRDMAEGPTLIHWNGEWLLYWDSYGARHYSLASSPDLVQWTDISRELSHPARHPRHGTVFAAERDAIAWPLEAKP